MSEASPSTKRRRKDRPTERGQTFQHAYLLRQDFWMSTNPAILIGEHAYHVFPDMMFTTEHHVARVAVECKEAPGMQPLATALGQALLYKEKVPHAVICLADDIYDQTPRVWLDAAEKASVHVVCRSGLAHLIQSIAPECERSPGKKGKEDPKILNWMRDGLNIRPYGPEFIPIPKSWGK